MKYNNFLENHIWVYIYPCKQSIPALAADYAENFGLSGAFDCILYEDKGKPYFKDAPNVYFSISHSGDYWLCAFSSRRIGADLQEMRPCSNSAISKRFFHPYECEYLKLYPDDNFFDIWSAKESYVKYTGAGISGGFFSFSVVDEKLKLVKNIDNADIKFIDFHSDYRLCICSEDISSVTVKFEKHQP